MKKKNKRKNKSQTETKLSYEALSGRGMARPRYVSAKTEDRELNSRKRLELNSQFRDVSRNFALFGFAIRQHLSFVANFRFTSLAQDENLAELIESRFSEWANDPSSCDFCGRHSFWTLLQLAERLRLRDGDVGVLRVLKEGSRPSIQLIEGDRIRDEGTLSPDLINGVRVDEYGRVRSYCVWKRNALGGYEFEKEIGARSLDLIGYYESYDQIRGVSPIPSGVREFEHLKECFDLALVKMKLAQSCGIVVKRDKSKDAFIDENPFDFQAAARDFGPGTALFDLGLDEEAEILQDNTPSGNFQDFVSSTTRLALSALDIPYSFYDGSETNFYGSRGELNNYVQRVRQKQQAFYPSLNKTARWVLRSLELKGDLPFGASNEPFRWTGASIPLWRLVDDAKSWQVAISNGFIDPFSASELHGIDLRDSYRRIKTAKKMAGESGFLPAFANDSAVVNV